MSDLRSIETSQAVPGQPSRAAKMFQSILARFAFADPTDNYLALQAQRYDPSRQGGDAAVQGAEVALQQTVSVEDSVDGQPLL